MIRRTVPLVPKRAERNYDMKPFTLEAEEASIVLVGSLNPAIFHPEWLRRHKLITQDDVEGAEIEIVHRELSKFSLKWLKMDVTRDKITVRTNDPSQYGPLKDLVASMFVILEHTPINLMGMNSRFTYKVESEEIWHIIGDNLAPKSYWKDLPQRVGLLSMMIHCPRPDDNKGYIRIGVESLKSDYVGVHFNVNNHVELRSLEGEEETIQNATSILSDNWDKSLEFARTSCENILVKAIES